MQQNPSLTDQIIKLRQIEGSLNGVKGVFEWILDQNQVN